jgi:hypothetical protein
MSLVRSQNTPDCLAYFLSTFSSLRTLELSLTQPPPEGQKYEPPVLPPLLVRRYFVCVCCQRERETQEVVSRKVRWQATSPA